MTARGRRIDIDAVWRDDRMLDQIACGQAAHTDDRLAELLAMAHDEIAVAPLRVADGALLVVCVPPPARSGLRRILSAGAIATVVLLTVGTVTSAVQRANPASPLWPLTQVLYEQQAKATLAEHLIDRARKALAQRRYTDAQRDLDEARRVIAELESPTEAQRLSRAADVVAADLALELPPADVGQPESPSMIQQPSTVPTEKEPPTRATSSPPSPPLPGPPTTGPARPTPRAQGHTQLGAPAVLNGIGQSHRHTWPG